MLEREGCPTAASRYLLMRVEQTFLRLLAERDRRASELNAADYSQS